MKSLDVWRRRRNLSLETFGEMLGCDKARISRLIAGKARPSLEMLAKMAEVTNLPVSQLLREALEQA